MSFGTLFSSLLAIVISLAFVGALAWGTLWLLKRFQDGSFGRLAGTDMGRTLRFEKALPIGPRERLVLVEVDGEHLLLGVTAHAITPIRSWPANGDPTGEPGHLSTPEDAAAGDAAPDDLPAKAKRFRLRMANPDTAE
jgi:flagellar protein FliO/FliZ